MVFKIRNPNILNNMHLKQNVALSQKIAQKFIQASKTLSLAESCTGGLIGNCLTNVPGSSAFFLLGIIAYDNAAKIKLLGVGPALLKKHGAVSSPVAAAMAQGVRKILNTDYGLSVTGIAGPGGGSKTKPVGLIFIAICTNKKTVVKKFLFKGPRLSIKQKASQAALKMLAK